MILKFRLTLIKLFVPQFSSATNPKDYWCEFPLLNGSVNQSTTIMMMTTPAVLAQAIPPNTTQLGVILNSLNSISGVLMLLSAALIFFGVCYSLATHRRLVAYLMLLPLPVIISVSGWIFGTINSLRVVAASPDLHLSNQDIAGGLATSLTSLYVAILATSPSYFLLAYGLLSRTLNLPADYGTNATNPAKSLVEPRQPVTVTAGTLPATT